MSHYDNLGVDKDADDEDIKKAYRRRAAETHPDKGGDPDEFHKVRSSYLVLSDPKKRDQYDRTGKAEAFESDKVMDIIGSMFNEILEQEDVDETVDVMRIVKGAMSASVMNGKIEVKKLQPKLRRLEKMVKRFKKKSGDKRSNLFSRITQNKVDEVREQIDDIEKQIRDFERAMEIVDDYEFDVAYAADEYGSSSNPGSGPMTIRQFFINPPGK